MAENSSSLSFLEIAAQALMTILLVLLERRVPYTERSVGVVIALSAAAQALGGAAILAPALMDGAAGFEMLPGLGSIVRGCGSAVLLLALGRYLCSVEPRKSALYIATGYAIFGIVALSLSFASVDVVAFASLIFPLLTCLCLLWSNEKITFKRDENRRVSGSEMRALPLDLAFLLLLCALTSIVVGTLVPSMRSGTYDAYTILWPVVYFLILGTYCIWIFRFKHTNVNELWPFLMLIIFSGLLCYSSFSAMNADFAASFLRATQKTLILFCWVFLASAIYQYRLPSVLFFGLGNFIFIQAPNLLSHVASAFFLRPDAQMASAMDIGAIAIVGFVLIGAVVFVLMRRKPHEGSSSASISSENEYARAVTLVAERYGLTPREEEVASYAVRGYTFSQIADTLFISADTVRSHSKSLYRKLGIHKKQELIQIVEHAVAEIASDPVEG